MFIPYERLYISPERQRRVFGADAAVELVESIETTGLLHPPVVRLLPSPLETGETHALVAGERRIRAMRDIWSMGNTFSFQGHQIAPDQVPCTLLSSLDPLDAEEAELEENIRRADLTWQERAAATARLADFRKKKAQIAGVPAPTVADIAEEVRGSSKGTAHDQTRKEILVARHLDNPQIAKAKTTDEAFKFLKQKEDKEKREELAEQVGKHAASSQHSLFNCNVLDWCETAPDSQFDVILMDPPYGMGADAFGDSGGKTYGAHVYEDADVSLTTELAPHLFRLAKSEAHLYCFCDIDRFHELRALFTETGWTCFRTPLIWFSQAKSRAPWPEHGPQRKYELILYAMKGKKRVTKLLPDVLNYNSDPNLNHSAQKPVALYADLLRRSTMPGDRVFDPTCGTGTIIAAAHECRVRATAIELDPASYGTALRRLQVLDEQGELL